jgi:hypothetical protein
LAKAVAFNGFFRVRRRVTGSFGPMVLTNLLFRATNMVVSLKMVAQEILMCGLRQVPILGPAIEVVEGVQKRHELLRDQDRLRRVILGFGGLIFVVQSAVAGSLLRRHGRVRRVVGPYFERWSRGRF